MKLYSPLNNNNSNYILSLFLYINLFLSLILSVYVKIIYLHYYIKKLLFTVENTPWYQNALKGMEKEVIGALFLSLPKIKTEKRLYWNKVGFPIIQVPELCA